MNLVLVAAFFATAPTVSYQADAITAKKIVEDLARQSGVRMICEAAVTAEPIVADFREASLDDVRARIAQVLGAEWHESDGSFV